MQRFNMTLTSCPGDIAWLLGWVSKQKLNLLMLKHPKREGFMKSMLLNDELEQVLDEIERTKEGRHGGSYNMSPFMPGMAQKLHVKLGSTERLGRIQSLWIRYHEHIQIMRDSIRAERLSDIQLHIGSSAKMLPVMMAAGHSHYGKAIRFIL